MEQLRMVWPKDRRLDGEILLPAGYRLHRFCPGDEEDYSRLLSRSELGEWSVARLEKSVLLNPLAPRSIFFISEGPMLAATACGLARESAAELGWVAVDPDHRGQALALAVCHRVVQHLLDLGWDSIFLKTDDHRLAALKTYFRLGFVPEPTAATKERWQALMDTLQRW